MTTAHRRAVVLAAIACGAGVIALVLASERDAPKAVWAVFGPLVVWSFTGTGLYAMRRRPESRVGALMIALGFAWCLAGLDVRQLARRVHLRRRHRRPVGRRVPAPGHELPLRSPRRRGADRVIVLSGYLLFTVGTIPTLLFGSPEELGL